MTRRPDRHRLLASVGVLALLLGTGCSTDIRGRPLDPDPTAVTGPAGDPTAAATSGQETPTVDTDAPAQDVWDLASLTPPEAAEVISSVRRPSTADRPSYLLVATTTPEAARAVCDQLGGRLPVGPSGLSDTELRGWALEDEPPGELGVCTASLPGDVDVQRDVLLAETDGAATLWLSTYRVPPR